MKSDEERWGKMKSDEERWPSQHCEVQSDEEYIRLIWRVHQANMKLDKELDEIDEVD